MHGGRALITLPPVDVLFISSNKGGFRMKQTAQQKRAKEPYEVIRYRYKLACDEWRQIGTEKWDAANKRFAEEMMDLHKDSKRLESAILCEMIDRRYHYCKFECQILNPLMLDDSELCRKHIKNAFMHARERYYASRKD